MRAFALSLPDAFEDFPWGERVIKVNKKIFVFLGGDDRAETGDVATGGGFSLKLRESHHHAMSVPGAAPTGYGLGKAGWVSVPFTPDLPDIEVLEDWIEESYRAVALKRLISELDASRAKDST